MQTTNEKVRNKANERNLTGKCHIKRGNDKKEILWRIYAANVCQKLNKIYKKQGISLETKVIEINSISFSIADNIFK